MSRSGKITTLHTFSGGDGMIPAGLVRDSAGNLYGTAMGGSRDVRLSGCGVVFRLDPKGNFALLHNFTGGADGDGPGPLLLDSAGNLYGTTEGGGTSNWGVVFEITP